MYCPNCGKQIRDGSAFCTECGARITVPNGPAGGSNAGPSAEGDSGPAPKKPFYKTWWYRVFCVIVTIGVVILVFRFVGSDEPKTAVDMYRVLGQENEAYSYTLPTNAATFIREHPDFFPGSYNNAAEMSNYLDYSIGYSQISKNPSSYSDRLIYVSGLVVDCEEVELDSRTITYIHILDYDTGDSYVSYYLGTLDYIYEDDTVGCYFLPFSVVKFENMAGAYTEAIIGAACYVEAY